MNLRSRLAVRLINTDGESKRVGWEWSGQEFIDEGRTVRGLKRSINTL